MISWTHSTHNREGNKLGNQDEEDLQNNKRHAAALNMQTILNNSSPKLFIHCQHFHTSATNQTPWKGIQTDNKEWINSQTGKNPTTGGTDHNRNNEDNSNRYDQHACKLTSISSTTQKTMLTSHDQTYNIMRNTPTSKSNTKSIQHPSSNALITTPRPLFHKPDRPKNNREESDT